MCPATGSAPLYSGRRGYESLAGSASIHMLRRRTRDIVFKKVLLNLARQTTCVVKAWVQC